MRPSKPTLRSSDTSAPRDQTPSWLWIVPFLLILFWLVLRVINRYGFSPDEFSSMEMAGGFNSVNTILRPWVYLPLFDPWHVPGYFMVLNVWSNGVGWSVFGMRTLSLMTGILGIALTYRLAYEVSGRSRIAALAAAVTLGVSADFAFELQIARMYPQLVMFTAFTLWMYYRIMTRRREPGIVAYLGLLVGATGLIYTHYFGLVPLIIIGVTHLTFIRKITPRWWRVVGVMLVAGLLFTPWLNVMIGIVARTSAGERADTSYSSADILVKPLYYFSDGMPLVLAIVALLALRVRGARIAWLWAITVLVASIALNLVIKAISDVRYTLYFWPILALLVGLGIASAARLNRLLAALLIGIWLIGGVWFGVHGYANAAIDFAPVADGLHLLHAALIDQFQPVDQLIFSVKSLPGDEQLMQYYLHGLPLPTPPVYLTPGMQDFTALRANLAQASRIWLAYAPGESPADLGLAPALDPDFAVCKTQDVQGMGVLTLELLTRDPVCCGSTANSEAAVAQFGDGISLIHADPLTQASAAAVPVLLRWSVGDNVPLHTYSVSLQLLDGQGAKVAQMDYELWIGTLCYYRTLTLNPPAKGTYSLNLVVYNWKTGERLPATSAANGLTSDSFPLGEVSSAS